ncbi:hypothetical protein VD0004_g8378 [Verticillium dahliae]|nr:hypothetical protein VD0004_g8378 [Verticillium dahliae]PNH74546.1 hypothetical protein VD0001_g3009 [Verticillium dahliae]
MGFAVAGDPDADITPFSALILIGVDGKCCYVKVLDVDSQ